MAANSARRWLKRLALPLVGVAAGFLVLAFGLALFGPAPTVPAAADSLRFDSLKLPDAGALPALRHYRARDGVKLGYRHYQADEAVDTVLVLIHGSASHSVYLQPLAERISAAGAAHVYTPDLRGHGPAPVRRGDVDYIGQLEDDLRDFIAHIRARHPQAALVLGGHSSGGGLVIRFAGGVDTAGVDGYLLLAPYIHHTAPTMPVEDSGWAHPSVPRIIGLSMLNAVGIDALNHQVVIRFNMPRAMRDGHETLAYSYRLQRAMHPRDAYQADIAAMEVPVKLLAGGADEAFNARAYRPLFAQAGAGASVRVLDGVDHLGLVSEPAVAEEVVAWLRSPAITISP